MTKSGAQFGNRNRQKYEPLYCTLVANYLENFHALSTFGSSLPNGFKVSYMTVTRWVKKYPDFAFAVDIGTQRRNEKLFRIAVRRASHSSRIMAYLMKCLLGIKKQSNLILPGQQIEQEAREFFTAVLNLESN